VTAGKPRVRIAPSPTGNLHVGTARTALFNYLFAKNTGGTFILRIEDTDAERSDEKYTQNIYDGLRRLGLTWDEGPDVGGPYAPYSQMARLDTYQRYAEKLLTEGKAYWSYETQEELDAQREAAMEAKQAYVYVRPQYTPEQLAAYQADPNRKPSLRFKCPDDQPTVLMQDIIRGDIPFETALIGDFVIMKSNGTPTYNFACVVDDIEMAITHIIRGEDHISNTPKQILLFDALGHKVPELAHVGMILNADRSKLSKRHGATSISEFLEEGYLPTALCNFLSLLGWAPRDGQEVGTLEDFAKQFDLAHIAHSPAVFDREKLNWFNANAIRNLPLPDFQAAVAPYLTGYDLSRYSQDKLDRLWLSVREPMILLADITEAVSYFFEAPKTLEADAQATLYEAPQDAALILNAFMSQVLPAMDFTSPETVGATLKPFTKSETMAQFKVKQIMWTLRAALTGRVHGADLSNTLVILGQPEVQSRITSTLDALKSKV
jgi:nondiscriminating glutamyl-tRNA synthetase